MVSFDNTQIAFISKSDSDLRKSFFLFKVMSWPTLVKYGGGLAPLGLKLGFKGDERDYGIGAQIIRDLGIKNMRLMSNNPTKRTGLVGYGISITENVAIEVEGNEHNEAYMKTKRDKMGHILNLDK